LPLFNQNFELRQRMHEMRLLNSVKKLGRLYLTKFGFPALHALLSALQDLDSKQKIKLNEPQPTFSF